MVYIFQSSKRLDPNKVDEEVDVLNQVATHQNIENLRSLVKFIQDRRLYITRYLKKFTMEKKSELHLKASKAPIQHKSSTGGLRIPVLKDVRSRNQSQLRDLKSNRRFLTNKYGEPIIPSVGESRNMSALGHFSSQKVLTN